MPLMDEPGTFANNGYPPPGASAQYGGYSPSGAYAPYGTQGDYSKLNTYSILAIVFAFVFAPLGIVFGALARGLSKVPGAPPWMKTVGDVGFWLSLAFTALPFLLVIPFLISAFFGGARGAQTCQTDPVTGAVVCEHGGFWNRGTPTVTPPTITS